MVKSGLIDAALAVAASWPAIFTGAVFRIERRGSDYFPRWISAVAMIACAGSRREASERTLAEAFARGGRQQAPGPDRLNRGADLILVNAPIPARH